MIRPHTDSTPQGLIGRIKRRHLFRLGFLAGTLLAVTEITALTVPFIKVNKILGLGAKIAVGTKASVLDTFKSTNDAPVPFTELAPTRIGAHVEQPSERRHYVHNEDLCSACIARHLTGAASHPATPAFDAPRLAVFTPAAPLVAPDVERGGPLAARAPPSPIRLG